MSDDLLRSEMKTHRARVKAAWLGGAPVDRFSAIEQKRQMRADFRWGLFGALVAVMIIFGVIAILASI